MSIDMTSKDAERADLGTDAATPQQIPIRGWLQVIRRAWEESKSDQVPLLAAGVAFFSFLSLFPAMIAAVMVYGLVRDPGEVSAQAQELADTLPDDAASLLTTQMEKIASTPQASLGLGLMVSLVLALWAASGGVGNIITSINLAYSEDETRGLVKRKALALGLTAGAIVFVLLAVALVAVAPPVLDSLVGSGPLRWVLEAIRWTLLLIAMSVMLAVLYRIAPDRRAPKFRWVSVGALVATVIWLLASFGFSIYVENFGSYGETYGALAGVVVLLLWLWITMFVVLFGAEINAESEHQTTADTTVGENQPIGKREAVKADTVANQ
jgi:membrane protein